MLGRSEQVFGPLNNDVGGKWQQGFVTLIANEKEKKKKKTTKKKKTAQEKNQGNNKKKKRGKPKPFFILEGIFPTKNSDKNQVE